MKSSHQILNGFCTVSQHLILTMCFSTKFICLIINIIKRKLENQRLWLILKIFDDLPLSKGKISKSKKSKVNFALVLANR